MKRLGSAMRLKVGGFDFGDVPATGPLGRSYRHGLRLATPTGALRGPFDRAQGGPEKYQILDVRRRRAQIRARRILGLT